MTPLVRAAWCIGHDRALNGAHPLLLPMPMWDGARAAVAVMKRGYWQRQRYTKFSLLNPGAIFAAFRWRYAR